MDDQREIFDEYHGRVYGFFRSRGFAEEDARELTQEALIRVFQNMDKLRSREARDAWVLRITSNVWKNSLRYRQAGKRGSEEISLDDERSDRPAVERVLLENHPVAGPLDHALASEHRIALDRCLGELPPRQRRCLVLHAFQDRKYQEIADLLKISIQSVKSHIHQARQNLRHCIDRRLDGEAP